VSLVPILIRAIRDRWLDVETEQIAVEAERDADVADPQIDRREPG
jgi:hypothetical protein